MIYSRKTLSVRIGKDPASFEAPSLKLGDATETVLASAGRMEITRDDRIPPALQNLLPRWKVPTGYRFNRDEANER